MNLYIQNGPSSALGITGSNVVSLNTWLHLAVTIDSAGHGTMYVNGLQVAEGNGQAPVIATRLNQLFGRSVFGDAYFKGKLDDYRLYNRALSSSEISYLYNGLSLLFSFVPTSGSVDTSSNTDIQVTISGHSLSDGVHNESIVITSNDANSPHTIPVTINVDFTPPAKVQNLVNIDALTDSDQITISWNANALADSVRRYKIYRKSINDTAWLTIATVLPSVTQYIDRAFTGLDTTWVYYKVAAIDNADNESAASDSIMTTLKRFRAPENITIENLNNWHTRLQWSPVTQTMAGTPGIPSCYIIYKSDHPVPLSDFDYLGISATTEFIHSGALWFQPADQLFYVVTAYGGDLPWLRQRIEGKMNFKYGELPWYFIQR